MQSSDWFSDFMVYEPLHKYNGNDTRQHDNSKI